MASPSALLGRRRMIRDVQLQVDSQAAMSIEIHEAPKARLIVFAKFDGLEIANRSCLRRAGHAR